MRCPALATAVVHTPRLAPAFVSDTRRPKVRLPFRLSFLLSQPSYVSRRLGHADRVIVLHLLLDARLSDAFAPAVVAPAPESERSLTVEALTALDTDPAAVAATQAARVTVDSDLGRMASDGPCASPAHTSSTHGELEVPAVTAGAAVASTSAAAAATVADAALEAALTSAPLLAGAKDQSRSRKESRFKVVKVVDGRGPAEAGAATPAARVSVESAPAQVGGTPASQQGVSAVNGSQQDALNIVNKKLQACAPCAGLCSVLTACGSTACVGAETA